MLLRNIVSKRIQSLNSIPKRSISITDVPNYELFEHKFTDKLEFKSSFDKIKCFRVIDHDGKVVNKGYDEAIPQDKLLKIFETMIRMNEADTIFLQAQRSGRISFYMTGTGEEATTVGSCSAVSDEDLIFPQYREAGALLWRGYTLQDMANQLAGNHFDVGKSRQMPVHYGSKKINFVTVSSPLCTQVPQASGAGYQFRIKDQDRIAITYFGDGSASEGDFHPAMNFAATLRCQTMFFCRNNMYAISTPIDDQYAGDGIAVRGIAYGMHTIRVDGNDIFAVYNATQKARELIIREKKPVLIEAISYRVGDHSTSDFSERYRDKKEMEKWEKLLHDFSNPISRLEKYLLNKKLITEKTHPEIREQAKKDAREALKFASAQLKPDPSFLFTDVYKDLPPHLEEQWNHLKGHMKRHGSNYGLETMVNGEKYL